MEYAGEYCFAHPSGKNVFLYTLRNINKTEVQITNYGAIIMAYKICMPDETMNDIVLGFEDPHDYLNADYLKIYPFMGAAIGRYANRIRNGSFRIDNNEIFVSKNWGPDQLHGGFEGFDKKVWDFVSLDVQRNILQLRYNSPDGDEGFPGNLEVSICFELNDENELIYEYTATCDQPTAVNLSHHSYLNLNNGKGTIEGQEVKIYADKILEQDKDLIATGNYIAVDNTKYDFREFHLIGERMNGGYDQSFVIEKPNQLSIAAEARLRTLGLKLQILTTEPVVHFYTAQGLTKLRGKNNIDYGPYSGFCLETQKHPNAVNIPKFPDTILRPGEKYKQSNVYKVII